jgi:hypothetical protein
VASANSLSVQPGVGSVSGTGVQVTPAATTTCKLLATSCAKKAVASVTVTVIIPPAKVTFSPTGSRVSGRQFDTATLLPGNKVLMAGGWGGDEGLNQDLGSCERFDPALGTFSVTGGLTLQREEASATLLTNGLVLIAGKRQGSGGTNGYPFADLFDPATGTAVAACADTHGGEGQTATLLPGGEVLITGGETWAAKEGMHAAYLFNPAGNSLTATGPMAYPRLGHTATLLANGRVLVAGGGWSTDGSGMKSAELYG